MVLQFEWNLDKEKANIKKHGVDFEIAAEVFQDENRIEIYDARHSNEEERFITIGISVKVLFVVYTIRNERIRIISARLATKKEREAYYGN